MEKSKKPFLPLAKSMVVPFAVGMLMCATTASAAEELARSVYTTSQAPQKDQITGRVVDSNGEPLIGVSVVEKGNRGNGAVTDVNGNFSLKASPNSTLVVSYVGYKAKDVKVDGRKSISVTLAEDAEMLNDVVVIGYGTVKKADLAGSVAVMDSKSFKDQPITSASDAINGRVSGVNVVSSGVPGSTPKIRVRGSNSVTKSNDPLYVVDGMVRESGLEGINPEDIQSMQVLKDASSTAIYGSRGANGVVIVTTKTGVKGESKITLDASWGWSKATRLPKMLGTKEYAQALVDYSNKTEGEYKDYLDGTNPGVDWIDEVFRTGLTQNYKVVFTKGTEGMQAYVSGNYMKTEGTIVGSQYERYSAKVNLKSDIKKWLKMTVDMNASRGVGKGVSGLAASTANPLWAAFNSAPAMNMYDENGNYNPSSVANFKQNALGQLLGNESERRSDVLNGHIDLQFNICKGLTFTTSNGFDYMNSTGFSFSPMSVDLNHQNNSMGNSNSQRLLLQSTNNLTYTHSWGDHNLVATGVWEATKSTSNGIGISGSSINNEGVKWYNVSDANVRNASNSFSDWALLSGVGRVMYNYADRYMLTGTIRADGSSRFTNNKWGYFPSIAAAWTVTNEKFMESTRNVLSNLKIRASYGVIGNQDISPYSTLALLSAVSTTYGTSTPVPGYALSRVATPDLKWEKTKQFDLGFDFGFFNNRLELSVDYFNKQTTDAILGTTTSATAGGFGYNVNVGKVANHGFDFALTARVIESKDWTWSSSVNASYIKNEVKKLTDQATFLHTGSNFQSELTEQPLIIKEGESLGSFWGFKWAGFDDEGYDIYYSHDGGTTRDPQQGSFEEGGDCQILGKSTPDFTLGWNNTVTYKNWTLNAFFNSAFGVQRLNLLNFGMNSKSGNSPTFTGADFLDYYGVNKATGVRPISDPTNDVKYIGTSSKWIENANYFRCENISLSYDMPKSLTKFADIRLSFSVQNLFTITNYKGSNPAGFSFSDDGDGANGIDAGTYPTPRTFTFGIRMNF